MALVKGLELFEEVHHAKSRRRMEIGRRASADRIRSHLLPSPLLSRLGARGFSISGPRPDVHSSLRPAPLLVMVDACGRKTLAS